MSMLKFIELEYVTSNPICYYVSEKWSIYLPSSCTQCNKVMLIFPFTDRGHACYHNVHRRYIVFHDRLLCAGKLTRLQLELALPSIDL